VSVVVGHERVIGIDLDLIKELERPERLGLRCERSAVDRKARYARLAWAPRLLELKLYSVGSFGE
jgi:hypothetical protein